MKKLKNQKGLTLIELLAVIVILGIIAAIAVPSIGAIMDNSKRDAHIANAEMLVNAARMAQIENVTKTVDPVTSGTNTQHEGGWTATSLESAGFLETIPVVPGGNTSYDGDDTTVVIKDGEYFVKLAADEDSNYTIPPTTPALLNYVPIELLRQKTTGNGRDLIELNPS